MNTEFFKYLLVVNDCHSINQAAEILHLQRSYLSRIISNLEKQLSIQIFIRNNKGVKTTLEGEKVIELAKNIVSSMNELEALSDNMLADNSKIVGDLTVYFPGYTHRNQRIFQSISCFQEDFPNVSVRLLGESNENIFQLVLENPFDLAFVFFSDVVDNPNKTLPPDLNFLLLEEKPLLVMAPKKLIFSQEINSISLKELANNKLAILSQSLTNEFFLYQLLADSSFPNKPDIGYITNDPKMLYTYLIKHDAFSISLPVEDLDKSLIQIPLKENIRIKFGILYNVKNSEDMIQQKFIKIVLNTFLQS